MKIRHRAVTSISIAVFLATMFISRRMFICEAIRKIQGKLFPWVWGIGLVFAFCIAYVMMLGVAELRITVPPSRLARSSQSS